MSNGGFHTTRYRFGEFELRPDQAELVRDGRPVPIQRQPLRVLGLLVARPGDLVRRSEITSEVWGDQTVVDFDRGLNYCIKQIREALGDSAAEPRFIRTVPREGYRFIAPVERLPRATQVADAALRKPSKRRLMGVAATALGLVLISLSMAWWFSTAGSEPGGADPLALQEFLRGRHSFESGSPGEAVDHFRQAVAIDPDFARGHLALAQAWLGAPGDPEQNKVRSRAALRRALELDDELAEAHALLAQMKLYADWDWKGAEQAYRRAIELEPHSARLRHGYASFLGMTGRHDEAIAEIEQAMQFDPLSTSIRADAAWFYYQARRFAEASRLCEVTLELDPKNQNALWCLLQSERLDGRESKAVEAGRRLARLLDGELTPELRKLEDFWHWHLGWLARNPAAARPSVIGLDHLALGEHERALELFEQAYTSRSGCVLSLPADPQVDPLRGNPRFESLLARLAMPS